jgi:dipeptidyl-peptidase-4
MHLRPYARPILNTLLYAILLQAWTIQAQPTATALKKVTLEDVWQLGTFRPAPTDDIRWMKNDNYYSDLGEQNILLRHAIVPPRDKAGKPIEAKPDTLVRAGELRDPKTGRDLNIDEYQFSADESRLLLYNNTQRIYRHSSTQVVYVFDLKTRKLVQVFDGKGISNPTLSPDGSKIGFCYQNNLYWSDLASGQTTQVTTDGEKNKTINGSTDWVYEEEFGFPEGFYWNADGTQLAYYKFDESQVPLFTMDMYGTLYPARYEFKYPKAGEKNSVVTIWAYNLASGKSTPIDVGAEKDQYIARIRWTQQANTLALLRLNRHQNKLELLLADAATGSTKVALTETSDTYIDVENTTVTFLKNTPQFLWMSERDGNNHLYLYDLSGKLVRQVTAGPWEITELYGVDEKTQTAYYQSTEMSPLEKHVYSIGLNGKGKTQLSLADGSHRASFSTAFTYYIDRYSNAKTPDVTTLYTNKGVPVKTLQENKALADKLTGYNIRYKEFFQMVTSQKVQLNGWMIKPADFDSSKKYPVLMFVYGGPGSHNTADAFDYGNFFWYQVLSDMGYMVVCVDNRGTGARGAYFKKCTYKDLGNLETVDQIEAAQWLGNLPFVDKGRIGIWGWSYGGYMTSLCMTKGADVFKTGIAVAPVTNWRFYDTIYTERYLRTPQENAKGYDDNSPINFVGRLKGPLLLVHGSGDDNVHYQNSLEMVNALVKANKQFDLMIYPNRNHGIYGGNTRLHLYRKMTDFLAKNL